MKLCWFLGVLTIALCEAGDAVRDKEIPLSVPPGTTGEPPSETVRNLTKRQIEPEQGRTSSVDANRNFVDADSNRRPLGKRDGDDSYESKRAKFSSWAGKRRDESIGDQPDYSKRAKFSSWAGKRYDPSDLDYKRRLLAVALAGYPRDTQEEYDIDPDTDRIEEKRKFSSWGGKRGDESYDTTRKFSSWSGKRSFPLSEADGDLRLAGYLGETALRNNGVDTELLRALHQKEMNFDHQPDDDEESNDGMVRPDRETGLDKRTRFSSWGGKRKFSSWGGKRSDPYYDTTAPFDDDSTMTVDKRARFSSWAGKRDSLPFWIEYQGKRGKFSSWAGKRSDTPLEDSIEQQKRRFSSWGGKRAFTESDSNDDDNYLTPEKRDTNWGGLKKKIKGRGFSSWGGKRSDSQDRAATDSAEKYGYDDDIFNDLKRATKFSSWAGKRSGDTPEREKRKFSSRGGKRSGYDSMEAAAKRAKFSSWSGKRSVDPNDGPEIDKRKDNRKNVLLRRYNRFNSWRGKKDNVATETDSTRPNRLRDVDFNQTGDPVSENKVKRGFVDYYRRFEMIKRNPLLRAWIGRGYPDVGLVTWKRKPAFSSWGGKRSSEPEVTRDTRQDYDDDVRQEKRTRFSNWGGKRHSVDKRSVREATEKLLRKLSANKKDARPSTKLAASRASVESRFYLRSSKDGWLAPAIRPIRRQFYAWGGKRASPSPS